MILYKHLVQPLVFSMEPEKAHHFTMSLAALGFNMPLIGAALKSGMRPKTKPISCMGLQFPNAVGLAAGFDKDGKYLSIIQHLGFGFIEVGTVTPRPQSGNPSPRLFRLKQDQALINRMGFNNEGLQALQHRLDKLSERNYILGGNIGKNKDTPNEEAVDDYLTCFEGLHDKVDYFVVNVSSPNTPGLRALQEKEPLKKILSELQHCNQGKNRQVPILLKVAPDITEGQIEDIAEIVETCRIQGLVTNNTSIDRAGLRTEADQLNQIGNGGLSGRPIAAKSEAILKAFRKALAPELTLIGVGGIDSGEEAKRRINAGADLVQLYSGLVYKGPHLVKECAIAIDAASR